MIMSRPSSKHIFTRNHPISIYKLPFSICKDYPNIVFMCHNTNRPEVIESIQRKIKRTKELFENNEPKTFNILETLSLGLQYYG